MGMNMSKKRYDMLNIVEQVCDICETTNNDNIPFVKLCQCNENVHLICKLKSSPNFVCEFCENKLHFPKIVTIGTKRLLFVGQGFRKFPFFQTIVGQDFVVSCDLYDKWLMVNIL